MFSFFIADCSVLSEDTFWTSLSLFFHISPEMLIADTFVRITGPSIPAGCLEHAPFIPAIWPAEVPPLRPFKQRPSSDPALLLGDAPLSCDTEGRGSHRGLKSP